MLRTRNIILGIVGNTIEKLFLTCSRNEEEWKRYFLYLLKASDKYFLCSTAISRRVHISRMNMICFFIIKCFFTKNSLNLNLKKKVAPREWFMEAKSNTSLNKFLVWHIDGTTVCQIVGYDYWSIFMSRHSHLANSYSMLVRRPYLDAS